MDDPRDPTRKLAARAQPSPEDDATLRERTPGAGGDGVRTGGEPPADLGSGTAVRDVGEYRIVRELGRGGMGVVYEAVQLALGRRVALKILPFHAAFDADALERFRREAATASRFDHPGLCTVFGTGSYGGTPYIAMRLVEGKPLLAYLAEARAAPLGREPVRHLELPEPPAGSESESAGTGSRAERGSGLRGATGRLVAVLERTARAVHHAHEMGVLHRDLKPGNIMITPAGDPVVLDFGLARELGGEAATLTATGDVFGTPAYMAPEQAKGELSRIGRQVDVWALGVTLFEALTLKRPFEAPTREALVHAICTEEPPRLRRLLPSAPHDLEVVLGAALEKDPARRYLTALDFAEELRRVRMREPIRARPVGPFGRLLRWTQRNPAAATLALVVTLGLAVIGGLLGVLWAQRGEVRIAEATRLRADRDELVERGFVALTGPRDDEKAELARADAAFGAALSLDAESAEARLGRVFVARRRYDPAAVVALTEGWPLDHEGGIVAARCRIEALRTLGRAPAGGEPVSLPEPISPVDCALSATLELELSEELKDEHVLRALRFARRAVASAKTARPLFHYEWARAAGYALDRDDVELVAAALVALWPGSVRSWWYAGFALQKLGDHEAAVRHYERALMIAPEESSIRFNLGYSLQMLGRAPEAEAAYRAAIRRSPHSFDARNNLALLLGRVGRNDEAFVIFEEIAGEQAAARARGETTNDDDVRGAIAQLMVARERPGDARRIFEEILAERPDDAVAHDGLAMLDSTDGDDVAALRHAEAAVRAAPERATFRARLGLLQVRAGDSARGLATARAALAMPDAGYPERALLAQALAVAGEESAALAIWKELSAEHPDSLPILNNHAMSLARTGDTAGAIELFRRAIERAPRAPTLHHNLVDALVLEQRVAEFAAEMERYDALDPTDIDGWRRLAKLALQFRLEEPDEVRPELVLRAAHRAAELAGRGDASALHVLSLAQSESGAAETAVATAREALRLIEAEADGTPDRERLKRDLEALIARSGRRRE